MKSLLKKFKTGGGEGRSSSSPQDAASSSSSPQDAASSSSALASASASASSSAPANRKGHSNFNGGTGGARVSNSNVCDDDFNYLEEEFQVQLALAISASSSSMTPGGEESRQIKAATRLSLQCSSSNGASPDVSGESLARRYWDYNVLDYDEKILDGFYDVYSTSSELNLQGPIPRLDELQQFPISNYLDYEVVLVNRVLDPALESLEQIAACVSLECEGTGLGPVDSGLIQKIADIVANYMGGPVSDANDMLARWTIVCQELRASSNNIVLPLGCLQIGLSRHRALLFKVLADHVGIPCRLVKGSHYTGIDGGAVNIIKLDSEREFIIDLMGAPGTLIPGEIPSIVSAQIEEAKNLNVHQQKVLQKEQNFSLMDMDMYKPLNGSSTTENRTCKENSRGTLGDGDNVGTLQGLADTSLNDNMGDKKIAKHNKLPEIRNNEFRRRRENFLSCQGRSPHPNLRNNSFVNNRKVGDGFFFDGAASGKAADIKDIMAVPQPHLLNPRSSMLNLNSSNVQVRNHIPNCISDVAEDTSLEETIASKESCLEFPIPEKKDVLRIAGNENSREGYANNLFGQDFVYREKRKNNVVIKESNDYTKNIYVKRNLQQCGNQTVAKRNVNEEVQNHNSSVSVSTSKLDTVMDDVAEWEIPWEDLIIGERIGLGSYGEVYHAEWNGTEVAVKKFLDQDFSGDALEEFRSEVRIMRRLRHPNVVLFMGAVTRPPNLSIVTEFLPRGSLYRLIHRPNGQIDEKRRIRMALDVAKGMNCLHSSTPTIVHRDLKSPNLLVDKNWAVKVCDFGLSRMKQNTFLSSKSTAGTPEWMAPEVLRNEPSNEKCDVYSFGVILWELATLRMPWTGMNPMQVVGAVGFQNRRLDIPKDVDPLVARIIRECWQTDPNLRPSFQQLMVALKPLKRLVNPPHLDVPYSVLHQEQAVKSSQGS